MNIYFGNQEKCFGKSEIVMNVKTGFSFIEVIIATIIIGIMAMFLAFSLPTSLTTGQEVNDLSRAIDLSQKYMETVKSELAYKINFDSAYEGENPPVPLASEFTDNGYFTVETNVTDLETDTINGTNIPVLKEIDVNYIKTETSISMVKLSTLVSRPK
ncbi:MAG: prepilin-type N-terminal cleavage/methylation domain-containing protein [bacterium]